MRKRYTATERSEILKYYQTHTGEQTIKKYGISRGTLLGWSSRKTPRNAANPIVSSAAPHKAELDYYMAMSTNQAHEIRKLTLIIDALTRSQIQN